MENFTLDTAVAAVRAAVGTINTGIDSIHAPIVWAILDTIAQEDESIVTQVCDATKSEKAPWLFTQSVAFVVQCIDGLDYKGGKFVVDDDGMELHPCARLNGDVNADGVKWYAKIKAPSNKAPMSLAGKLNGLVGQLEKASKKGGPELAAGYTRKQAALAAKALGYLANGTISFEDLIALAEGPAPVVEATPEETTTDNVVAIAS